MRSKYPFFSQSKIQDEKRWETFSERQAAQREQSILQKAPEALQGSPGKKLHEPVVGFSAPSRVSELFITKIRLQIGREVLVPAQVNGQTAKKAKNGGGKGSVSFSSERKASGFCISRCGAAEGQLVLT